MQTDVTLLRRVSEARAALDASLPHGDVVLEAILSDADVALRHAETRLVRQLRSDAATQIARAAQ